MSSAIRNMQRKHKRKAFKQVQLEYFNDKLSKYESMTPTQRKLDYIDALTKLST